jgi:hypothetical protein
VDYRRDMLSIEHEVTPMSRKTSTTTIMAFSLHGCWVKSVNTNAQAY